MHAEIYTDGVDEITVGGVIVRVDLVIFRRPNVMPITRRRRSFVKD